MNKQRNDRDRRLNARFNVKKSEVDRLEVEYTRWLLQKGDNFTSVLFYLITKADVINAYKLATAFPNETYVVAKVQEKPILKQFEVINE